MAGRKQAAGFGFLLLGAALLLSALLLFLRNRQEDTRAGESAARVLRVLTEAIPDAPTEAAAPTGAAAASAESTPPEMAVITIDGYPYIGFIEIPKLALKLPVMEEWDDARLQISPCRQFGSLLTDDLVIAAHNYAHHFGALSMLTAGDGVQFTAADGSVYCYTVTETATLEPAAVDSVQNSGHDLVLYTCTYGGASRTAVFCDRAEPAACGEHPYAVRQKGAVSLRKRFVKQFKGKEKAVIPSHPVGWRGNPFSLKMPVIGTFQGGYGLPHQ